MVLEMEDERRVGPQERRAKRAPLRGDRGGAVVAREPNVAAFAAEANPTRNRRKTEGGEAVRRARRGGGRYDLRPLRSLAVVSWNGMECDVTKDGAPGETTHPSAAARAAAAAPRLRFPISSRAPTRAAASASGERASSSRWRRGHYDYITLHNMTVYINI